MVPMNSKLPPEPGAMESFRSLLTASQYSQAADHICGIPEIWDCLRQKNLNVPLEPDLKDRLEAEISAFFESRGWVASKGDRMEVIHFLVNRAQRLKLERDGPLAPGIYGGPEPWLTAEQRLEIADHVCAIPEIWVLMREITDKDRIEGKLELLLWEEVRLYIIRSRWLASGGDTGALADEFRARARKFQIGN